MLLGIRSEKGPLTLLANSGAVSKIGKKFGYTSWHPSGRMAVYSSMSVPELINEPVKAHMRQLISAIKSSAKIEATLPVTGATKKLQQPDRE
jgi:hypothetical protein